MDNREDMIDNIEKKIENEENNFEKELPCEFPGQEFPGQENSSYESDNSDCEKNSEIGPKDQFYMKLQMKRKTYQENKKKFYSAGILPFYVKNETIYFLIGKDNEGNWSDFGGRSDAQDMGRWDVTAAREFYEETIGSVLDIQAMMLKLQNNTISYRINGNTTSGSSYYMYLVKIPYKDVYRNNFHSTLSLLRYIKNDNKNFFSKFDYKYFEKTDIQWVSLETLKSSMDTNNNFINYPLRNVFKMTFEKHYDTIINFCKSENIFDFFSSQEKIKEPKNFNNYTSNFFTQRSNSNEKWRRNSEEKGTEKNEEKEKIKSPPPGFF